MLLLSIDSDVVVDIDSDVVGEYRITVGENSISVHVLVFQVLGEYMNNEQCDHGNNSIIRRSSVMVHNTKALHFDIHHLFKPLYQSLCL